jgi:hypothetical protein
MTGITKSFGNDPIKGDLWIVKIYPSPPWFTRGETWFVVIVGIIGTTLIGYYMKKKWWLKT